MAFLPSSWLARRGEEGLVGPAVDDDDDGLEKHILHEDTVFASKFQTS